jgi:hypothetical protein
MIDTDKLKAKLYSDIAEWPKNDYNVWDQLLEYKSKWPKTRKRAQ